MSLDSPDGAPLVRDLTFAVEPGTSVMLMGPNGCGKSRCAAGVEGCWGGCG